MMDKSEWSNEKKAFLGTEEKRKQARAALRAIRDMGDDTPEPLRVQMRLEECHKGLCRAEGERDQARAERDRLRNLLRDVYELFRLANLPEHERLSGRDMEALKRQTWRAVGAALADVEGDEDG